MKATDYYKTKAWRIQYDEMQRLIIEHRGDMEAIAYELDMTKNGVFDKLKKLKLLAECNRVFNNTVPKPSHECKSVLPPEKRTDFHFYSEDAIE